MAEERILPPFPDDVVDPPNKVRAIAFLQSLHLPSRIASTHLYRWSVVTGIELDRSDLLSVRRDLPFLAPGA